MNAPPSGPRHSPVTSIDAIREALDAQTPPMIALHPASPRSHPFKFKPRSPMDVIAVFARLAWQPPNAFANATALTLTLCGPRLCAPLSLSAFCHPDLLRSRSFAFAGFGLAAGAASCSLMRSKSDASVTGMETASRAAPSAGTCNPRGRAQAHARCRPG